MYQRVKISPKIAPVFSGKYTFDYCSSPTVVKMVDGTGIYNPTDLHASTFNNADDKSTHRAQTSTKADHARNVRSHLLLILTIVAFSTVPIQQNISQWLQDTGNVKRIPRF